MTGSVLVSRRSKSPNSSRTVRPGGLTPTARLTTESALPYTDVATVDSAKAVGKGADKSAKVTVYYTEEGGKKIAHLFHF